MNSESERRQDERIGHRGYGYIYFEADTFECHLLDVSMRGAKVAVLEPHNLLFGKEISLQIDLGNEETVTLHGQVAHVKEHIVGMMASPINSDDQSKLESLIAENSQSQNIENDQAV